LPEYSLLLQHLQYDRWAVLSSAQRCMEILQLHKFFHRMDS